MPPKKASVIQYIRQRKLCKENIERIAKLVETRGDSLASTDLECRLDILKTYFHDALEFQTLIEELEYEPEMLSACETRGELEELYCKVKSQILQRISTTTNVKPTQNVVQSIRMDHLPKLKLPMFSGKYADYPNFINLFNTLVGKESRLTTLEKFNHLVSCLSGNALRTVNALDITAENYDKALSLLDTRFNNKFLMCEEHIKGLFSLQKISKASSDQLRLLVDTVTARFNALCSLNTVDEILNAFVVHLALAALDTESQKRVEEAIDYSKPFSWELCAATLNKRCQMLEARDATAVTDNKKGSHKRPIAVSFATTNKQCQICKRSDHQLWKCDQFLELSPLQRFEAAKAAQLCINCLSSNHSVKQCKSSKCRQCSSRHHTLLHRGENIAISNQNFQGHQPHQQQHQFQQSHVIQELQQPCSGRITTFEAAAAANNTFVPASADGYCHVSNDEPTQAYTHTILATVLVNIFDKHGNIQLARALLDSASQINFMTRGLLQKLNLDKVKATTMVGGIGESQCKSNQATNATIGSRLGDYSTSLQFVILPTITGHQPNCKIDIDSWNIPKQLQLADPQFNTPQRVELLIGADIFFELLCSKQIQLGDNLPTLLSTKLGWIVSGKYTSHGHTSCSLIAQKVMPKVTSELEALVQRFWDMEKVPEAPQRLSKEQADCEVHFQKHVKRLPFGRFMVKLPLKMEPTSLGDSQNMAIRRFLNLEKRLSADCHLKKAYSEFLKDYESADHMQQVSWPKSFKGYYLLPHHCVLRPQKSTTKCRVVFDASAKTTSNLSLNDIMMVGPVVQCELFEILLRFRLHRFGLMADVAAMYRQIMVYPDDQRLQNIVWRESKQDNLQLYTLKTVTYGTAAAPFLATRCLLQLAEENRKSSPLAAQIIKQDFYVDDLISGGSTLDEILQIKHDVCAVLEQAQFKLRKWHSNHSSFLSTIAEDDREKSIKINNTEIVKALGVIWESKADVFKFSIDPTSCTIVTKRSVLSGMSKLFDPLGIVKPVIIKAKIFLQELWLKKLDWDEPLPEDLSSAWTTYIQQLADLNNLTVPRYALLPQATLQLHGFADASTRAYGCCLYLRSMDKRGKIQVTLYAARSKVAPISVARSLPCLELSAAHLLVQLLEKVRKLHDFGKITLWSDSVIVLNWLLEHASNYNTFVANRVSYIQEHTANTTWRYVPSTSNPADIISRGCTVQELSASIWLSGPEFLQKPEENWPQFPKRGSHEDLPERKPQKSVLVTIIDDSLLATIYNKSSFCKNCTCLSYVRRFITNCRSRSQRLENQSIQITATEFDKSLLNIISMIQQHCYAADIKLLQDEKPLGISSPLKSLNPFIDQQDGFVLVRVGGRLKHSQLPYEAKYPILLPNKNQFVCSYFKHVHLKNLHIGAQALLSKVRERFFVIGGRDYARKTVQKCVHCFRYRPKLMKQLMGDLPRDRLTPVKPFTFCGVDFCGPIPTTARVRGQPKYKSYVAVFVCFVTRAVHLEVVSDLTSEAFIAALKRFVGRRGLCTTLYCDNGTNFVGAKNILKELKLAFMSQQTQQNLTAWCTENNIEFRHIPPRSPHFGGIWEAAVKSAKSLLYKTMQSAVLTFEELSTVMAQIEGILNSRPLTALSTDPSDEHALTPAHFLNQSRAECIIEPIIPFANISRVKQWKHISAIQQHFWQRWTREYITTLQQRNKWDKSSPNLYVGAVVIIHEDNLPPQKWLMGRITQIFTGADGKVRVAEIKTPTGLLKRSIVKLALLPIEDNSIESS